MHWSRSEVSDRIGVLAIQLFLGTKEFPEEDGYSKFLSQNGGYSNAYTASEDTNFFFEVLHPHCLSVCSFSSARKSSR
jgi:secreted Zn-dependent insulinase-like peptidase